MKTKQIKLKKLSDEVLSNGTKIVVLGDKPTNGANINPDGNTTTSNLECLTCGKRWVATTRYNETSYEEIK